MLTVSPDVDGVATLDPCEFDAAELPGIDPECGFARKAPTLHACTDRDGKPIRALSDKTCWSWARSQMLEQAGRSAFETGTCQHCGGDAGHGFIASGPAPGAAGSFVSVGSAVPAGAGVASVACEDCGVATAWAPAPPAMDLVYAFNRRKAEAVRADIDAERARSQQLLLAEEAETNRCEECAEAGAVYVVGADGSGVMLCDGCADVAADLAEEFVPTCGAAHPHGPACYPDTTVQYPVAS